MRATSLFLTATAALTIGAMAALGGAQAPAGTPQQQTGAAPAAQTPAAPAAGRGALGTPGVAATPENPRPNQPGFIGWERQPPNMGIPAGFTPLFNGMNLSGWHVSTTNHHGTTPDFRVEHGMIIGTQRPLGGGGILLTDRKFKDFELYLEVKPDWGCDSGIFLRSTEWGAAYQVTMDYLPPNGGMGNVIGEGGMPGPTRGRGAGAAAPGGAPAAGAPAAGAAAAGAPPAGRAQGAGAPPAGGAPAIGIAAGAAAGAGAQPAGAGGGAGRGAPVQPVASGIPLYGGTPLGTAAWTKVWKREDWNSVRVRMVGAVPRVTVWINDVQISDMTDTENRAIGGMIEGPIAIQVHGGTRWVPGGFWRWRVIAIKEL